MKEWDDFDRRLEQGAKDIEKLQGQVKKQERRLDSSEAQSEANKADIGIIKADINKHEVCLEETKTFTKMLNISLEQEKKKIDTMQAAQGRLKTSYKKLRKVNNVISVMKKECLTVQKSFAEETTQRERERERLNVHIVLCVLCDHFAPSGFFEKIYEDQ